MENEIWKDIAGYDGVYQVSNMGRVKSFCKGKEKILKPKKDKYGYLMVGLYKDEKQYWKKIHRIVAEAFLDNPNNLPCVNHLSEDKTDNRVENLCWVDHKTNINYGTRNKRVSKALSKSVLQYSLDGTFVNEWQSTHEVERQLGFANQHISKCCNGKRKTCGGYKWYYKQTENK